MDNSALNAARQALAERRATGKPVKRLSRAKALRHYFLELEGAVDDAGNARPAAPDQGVLECRREAREQYRAAVAEHGGLVRTVKSICFDCVGGDADSGPKLAVRDCTARSCPLYPIRPWQEAKSRKPIGGRR